MVFSGAFGTWGNIFFHFNANKWFTRMGADILGLLSFDQDKAMKMSKGKGPPGLVIMRERAMQLNGELTIESILGKWSLVYAYKPWKVCLSL